MPYRKIYSRIKAFYENNPNKALMIAGARQIGKSFIIEEFCKVHYESYIKIDFIENQEYASLFANAGSAEDILL